MFLLRKFQSKSWMHSENFIILKIHNFSKKKKINLSSHPAKSSYVLQGNILL